MVIFDGVSLHVYQAIAIAMLDDLSRTLSGLYDQTVSEIKQTGDSKLCVMTGAIRPIVSACVYK